MNKTTLEDLKMPDALYYKALWILYARIKNGEALVYGDNIIIGFKETYCSWGLCSNQIEQWPDPEMHLWPEQFIERGRVAHKYLKDEQRCPNDTRIFYDPPDDRHKYSGCFYSCMFFNPIGSIPTRDQVIAHILYLVKGKEDQPRLDLPLDKE